AEGEIKRSPMANMKPPIVPEAPPAVLTEAQIDRLMKVTAGKTLTERRDRAIICLFADTGCRLSEIAGLSVADVDFENRVIIVLGKGRRPRIVPFGNKTGQAL